MSEFTPLCPRLLSTAVIHTSRRIGTVPPPLDTRSPNVFSAPEFLSCVQGKRKSRREKDQKFSQRAQEAGRTLHAVMERQGEREGEEGKSREEGERKGTDLVRAQDPASWRTRTVPQWFFSAPRKKGTLSFLRWVLPPSAAREAGSCGAFLRLLTTA